MCFSMYFPPMCFNVPPMFFQCVSRTLRISGLGILAVAKLLNWSLLLVKSIEYWVSVLGIGMRGPFGANSDLAGFVVYSGARCDGECYR